jgi:hypothetical protein
MLYGWLGKGKREPQLIHSLVVSLRQKHQNRTIWNDFGFKFWREFGNLNKYNMGRPAVLPKKKKDGFWLEVRNKGAKSGGTILIRDSYEAMMLASRQYQSTKDVIILGEHRDGKKVEGATTRKKKEAA